MPVAKRRWVASVTTDSTHPEKGLFTKSASTIAKALASKKVSPKGPASGMRMLNYFINRGGRGLAAERRRVLEQAKVLLSKKIKSAKPAKPKATRARRPVSTKHS
jgi:tRNA(adenine34) deaminase